MYGIRRNAIKAETKTEAAIYASKRAGEGESPAAQRLLESLPSRRASVHADA